MQYVKGYNRNFRPKHILFRNVNKIETGMCGNYSWTANFKIARNGNERGNTLRI